MTDYKEFEWCDFCCDCAAFCALGDDKYACKRQGGICEGYFAYKKLEAENAALHERLDKAVELPAIVMIDRTLVNGKFKPTQKAQAFNGRIGVVYQDKARWGGLLVDVCSEKTFDYEAAEKRLAELGGE